jgi:Fe2+ or Zn2+ uptake regulation protein
MLPFVTAKASSLHGDSTRAKNLLLTPHGRERAARMLEDLKRAGLKMTPQRIAIVRLFAVDESHPTAQALFERLRPEFPSMSFATVYNTLDALATAGLSNTLRLGSAARFDPNTTPHHHAVCEECGAVRDVPAHSLASSRAATRRVHRIAPGFRVRLVERVYRGLCAACAAHQDGPHRANPEPDSSLCSSEVSSASPSPRRGQNDRR